MITHSYAMDSQNKSEELAATILASSSPSTISAACSAVEAFLQKHNADQSRSFFSIVFPALICKIFGFDETTSPKSPSSGGWIDQIQASGDSELAGRVFDLLSPSGVLLSSVFAVDRHSLVKYVFPFERLPKWARFVLQNDRDCRVLSDLCPLFTGRIKGDPVKGSYHVQLNVFEYYMFWFAYYPVCRGNCESSDAAVVKKSRKSRLENWTSSLPVLGVATRGLGHKNECSLYIRLLYAYLRAFVPEQSSNDFYRSSLLHYSSGYDGSVVMQTEFLVNTLIHFWLVDDDFSPLSVNVFRSYGVSFPFRAVLGETPPTCGLGEVVRLFVKYLMRSLVSLTDSFDPVESTGSPLWRVSGSVDVSKSRAALSVFSYGSSVGSWTSLVQRPLYRFVVRTFLFCPMEASIKNASQVFSLWITYIEPWKIRLEDFAKLDALVDQSTGNLRSENFQSGDKKDDSKEECQGATSYTSPWQGFVLSNYLFYSSLVMHFLGFSHKFLHTDAEAIIQMVSKVLNVLTSSRELMDLIKRVDASFHSKPSVSSSSMNDNVQKCVPSIRTQLQDWEDGLSESDADGSFLHENWNQDLSLFRESEDGGRHLLQLLILRAESEIQETSGDNLQQNLQTLDSLKAQMCCLFGGTAGSTTVKPEVKQVQCTRDEIFKPRRVGNQTLASVKFKGDWMKRPVSDGEVAWLARLLVSLSDWLNETLGLTQEENRDIWSSWSSVELPGDELGKVGGFKDALRLILCSIGSCLVVFAIGIVKFMKLHGLRVNLRVLASKKIVVVLLLSALFGALKKACGQCLCPQACNLV